MVAVYSVTATVAEIGLFFHFSSLFFLRLFSSETYAVEDCVRYITTTYNADRSWTINATLPSNFKVEYEEYITQSSNNSCYLGIGETTSRAILFGKITRAATNYTARVRTSASGSGDITYDGSTIPLTGWNTITVTYDGTTFNFNDDISITDFNGVSLTYLTHIGISKTSIDSGQVRNIKIKPL